MQRLLAAAAGERLGAAEESNASHSGKDSFGIIIPKMITLCVRIDDFRRTHPEDFRRQGQVGVSSRFQFTPIRNAAAINDVINRRQGRICRFYYMSMEHGAYYIKLRRRQTRVFTARDP